MPHIIPITDLRDTNKVTELCAANEPVFVTKNGYGAMVIMSMDAYEQARDEKILLERLQEMKEGKLLDGEMVLAELRTKYGQHI